MLRFSKKLGDTARISADEYNLDETYFWLWTNDSYTSKEKQLPYDDREPIINLFSGETLLVSVEFYDGTYCTKYIELHCEYFELVGDYTFDNPFGADTIPTPRNPSVVDDGTYLLSSLYGEIVQTTDEPFSGEPDNVNELENVVSNVLKTFLAKLQHFSFLVRIM